MRTFAVVALFALVAVAMAATEEKKDLQASPSLLYGGIGLGGIGYGGLGLHGLYGLQLQRLALLQKSLLFSGGLGLGIGGGFIG